MKKGISWGEARQRLQSEGLRFARPNEDSWAWAFVDQDGEMITWWVTWA